jgi:predicted CXXCH cytochrome family protein
MKRRMLALGCIVLGACAGVLGLSRRAPQSFPHRAHVTAGVACTRCHTGIETAPTALHIPDDASCTTCHTKPHDTRPCLSCHAAPGALAQLVEAREHLIFDHKQHGPVTRGDCMRCHVGIAEGDSQLRPPMATCFRCHDTARDARQCDACHKNLEDTRLLPQSHLAHDGDWMREHGARAAASGDLCQSCHQERFCAGCHGSTVPALPAERRFANPFTASVHRAGFAARHSLEARSEPGACTTCHAPDRCAACHTSRGIAGEGRRSPHPPGWVGPSSSDNEHGRQARRDPAACASCHDGAGQSLCVGCHKVGGVGGNPHPAGWSSRVPLTAMPCRMCHPIGSKP